ncbi:5-hydroxytryptamine receptor 1-like [Orbicella faveolata]|uniref:5-hydroxytryptamine receptor 1-like n=1 Tax=Orbicella faveolata TaxID=48498 RepID=UPI0009E65E6B|nr:5-hydroxytryptamine receptor 1-like [Orbicella faveolata]
MASVEGSVIETIILVLICATSVLGNISLIFVITRRKSLRTICNGFLLNLVFADLLVSVLNMPITVVTIVEQRWIFGDRACNLLGFTTMLSFVSSVMWLAMIAINRYYYVVQWKVYPSLFTPRRSVLFAGTVWLISLLLSIPPLFGWAEYRYIPGKSYCFVSWPSDVYYMYFMLIICFFGPLSIMCLSYYNILKFTREAKQRVNRHRDDGLLQQETQRKQENNTNVYEQNRKRLRMTQEEVKITNTLMIVVACFMACWAPFAITMFFDVYYSRPLPRTVDISTLLLGYANSMCNPVVYGIRTQAFRRELVGFYTSCLEKDRVDVPNSFPVSSAAVCEGDTLETQETPNVSRVSREQNQPIELKSLHLEAKFPRLKEF